MIRPRGRKHGHLEWGLAVGGEKKGKRRRIGPPGEKRKRAYEGPSRAIPMRGATMIYSTPSFTV